MSAVTRIAQQQPLANVIEDKVGTVGKDDRAGAKGRMLDGHHPGVVGAPDEQQPAVGIWLWSMVARSSAAACASVSTVAQSVSDRPQVI